MMEFTVVSTAEWDRDFVGDLYPKSTWLRKAQVARIAGLAAADKAGLFRHQAQVLFVPRPRGNLMYCRVRAHRAGLACSVDV